MKVLLLCQYYVPEEQNAFVHECALGLKARGHDVRVQTAFPHYGKGEIYDGYKHKLFQRELIDDIPVTRTWVYATPRKSFYARLLTFISFCLSALIAGLLTREPVDALYVSSPPLFLAITAILIAWAKNCRLILHIQDIYPRVAIQHGFLKNPHLIRIAEWVEKWIYRRAAHIVVISIGFREDLLNKGVPPDKVTVVENWANPDLVTVMNRDNSFRRELDADGRFVVIYSGGLNHNSNLEPLLRAADLLRDDDFHFAVVGDGEFKQHLQRLACDLSLPNVTFFPFQPLARYPEVLAAADLNVVSLSPLSEQSSVPSKVYKQLAAGRAILAITPPGNELFRLVSESACGLCAPPGDASLIAAALRWAKGNHWELLERGRRGRDYFEKHHTLDRAMDRLSNVLDRAAAPCAVERLQQHTAPRS